eukprot:CAMPEP_0172442186 /NCGR_PEP_ID=MMETSP1065-20121228/2661_1 /TAXON_ID=265537 /ORGANISM="Amphiprora paludosa, Strain CCMP125" /LENGTH=116 /DNA_ID=CAMNT_0013191947 /DNA_START=136 /DNA_END=486 /DNA_ORIENTATION=+
MQEIDSPQERWFAGERRPRTQAIAIKQRPGAASAISDDFSDSDESTTSLHYDVATWRMYNRIVDYRQKNPLSDRYHQDAAAEKEQKQSATADPTTATKQVGFQEEEVEGGVFELEL